ncbi:MAG TPA: sigma factor, partial [Tepidisphaeraceae bacterium]|nr:sigma factor [Tepidisphaeraceae bacterium]
MNEADEALVTQSQEGNREAFEELVRRTARLVFSRIFLETGDAHRTEDLVQETFLSAWRRIGQVTDRKGFRPWLLSVAHSVTIDSLRHDLRKKRSGSRAKSDVLATLATPDPTPP